MKKLPRPHRKTVQLGLPGLPSCKGDPGPVLARHAGIEFLCGVDEVGRGPLAGPVVAGAVVVHVDDKLPRVADSKILTPNMRKELLEPIRKASRGHAVAEASVDEIDALGIVQANFTAMRRAVQAAMKMAGVDEVFIVVDGRDLITGLAMRQHAVIDGDALCQVIGAASILAKEHRDGMLEALHEKFPQYGFAKHKGYATSEHLKALHEHGPSAHHRRSFEPIKSFLTTGAWVETRQLSLDAAAE